MKSDPSPQNLTSDIKKRFKYTNQVILATTRGSIPEEYRPSGNPNFEYKGPINPSPKHEVMISLEKEGKFFPAFNDYGKLSDNPATKNTT